MKVSYFLEVQLVCVRAKWFLVLPDGANHKLCLLLFKKIKIIDYLNLLPRSPGVVPFAMVDGHGSRLELPFLKYINDTTTKWCVCLVVPHETAYWQVGDSKEQDGSFSMTMTGANRKLLDLKRSHCLKETIDKSDLILLINIAWNKSFTSISMNQRILLIEDGNHIIVIFLPCFISELQ